MKRIFVILIVSVVLFGTLSFVSADSADLAHKRPACPLPRNHQIIPTGIQRTFAFDNPNLDIDCRSDKRVDVDVAIIGTGIVFHPDLNVVRWVDCTLRNSTICVPDSPGIGDVNRANSTQIAGAVGAKDNRFGVVGIAPGARLWSIRVDDKLPNCTIDDPDGHKCAAKTTFDTYRSIFAGLEYVATFGGKIEVAVLDFTRTCFYDPAPYPCPPIDALDFAIHRLGDMGVVTVARAGSAQVDAQYEYPANNSEVITVGGWTDFDGLPGGLAGNTPNCPGGNGQQDDTQDTGVNTGSLIEIYAPSVCIFTTQPNGFDFRSSDGMAQGHVAGAASLLATKLLSVHTRTRVILIRDALISTANTPEGTNLKLLDVSNTILYNPKLRGH